MTRSGDEVLQGQDPEEVAAIRDMVFDHASRARENVGDFFEFVMRDLNNQPIKVAAHQEVGLEFIMAHDRSVNMWPIGSSKSTLMTGLSLYFLGRNPELRGCVVSAAEAQAVKIVQTCRDYIEGSVELAMVFPGLRRSTREGDPWTQSQITVERPPGLVHASLTAYGLESSKVLGSRFNWIIIDDVLNMENTATKDQRDKVLSWLDKQFLNRLDPAGGRVVATNTPWHPRDAISEMMRRGWATMVMDIYGDITVMDDERDEREGKFWDSPRLRRADDNPNNPACRLVAHDPDPSNQVPLWPERWPLEVIEERRRNLLPHDFSQMYRCIARDDAQAMCKQEFIEKALEVAREHGVHEFLREYKGPNTTFTGIDLAVSPGEEHDDTAFFTFEARPGGLNVILDIEVGQWDGPTIMEKMFDKQARFNSVVRVESNAAQDYLRQFALQKNRSLPIKAHMTGRAKAHPEHGVAGFFVELMNGAWAFPNRPKKDLHAMVRLLIDACLEYMPSRHTADVLMACYMARAQKREWMGFGFGGEGGGGGGSIAMDIMSR